MDQKKSLINTSMTETANDTRAAAAIPPGSPESTTALRRGGCSIGTRHTAPKLAGRTHKSAERGSRAGLQEEEEE